MNNEHQSTSSSSAPIASMRSIRVYSTDGQRSTRVECDAKMSCADICEHFSCDVITLQIGNYHFRQLKPDTCPLTILEDFCRILAMSDDGNVDETMASLLDYADSASFRHIFSFFLGKPRIRGKNSLSAEVLSEEIIVRRGKILHSWTSAKAVFYNSTIRLQMKNNEDEVIHMRTMKADEFDSKKGKALRLRDNDSNCYLLIFQRPNILQLWLSKAQQVERNRHVDLSDEQLTMIPEQILNCDSGVQILNLRRNSLQSRPPTEKAITPIGYIDDLYRLHTLQSIDLSANQIFAFPIQLCILANLRTLNVASNYISTVPRELANLKRLQSLNLSNNLLATLPDELATCPNLKCLDLSFNQFSMVPRCLYHLPMDRWRMAGNNIEKVDRVGDVPIAEIDLRRNILGTTFRLNIENIAYLDIRDNSLVSTVHLTNLRFLKIIHCERLQLTSLHLNGEHLTHIYADHNLLDSVVVMPLPTNLQTLSISQNHFKHLPDWICDCQHLQFIRANNNLLETLPTRIFCSTSIRSMFLFDNRISRIPDDVEDNCLETLILYKNRIQHLPKHFFQMLPKLRQLNVSSNLLEILPYVDGSSFCRLQILRAANNLLTENSVPVVVNMKHLKVVDLSHNLLNSFDDSALTSLELLEELNLSSNRLTRLPECLGLLPSLQILRAHSNQLVNIPQFRSSSTIHTIDVSCNNISLGAVEFVAPPTLRHFDVTCNSGDLPTESSLPLRMNTINIADLQQSVHGFQIGVSGSRGSKNKQCIRQLRVNNTFAFIDGGSNFYISSSICRFLSQFLRENSNCNIRSAILSCHCELGEEGERLGASILIMRVGDDSLELASTGTISAAIAKDQQIRMLINGRYEIDDDEYSRVREAHGFVDEENRINGIIRSARQIGHFSMFPVVLPTSTFKKIAFNGTIEGLVIANSALWTMMGLDDVSTVFYGNRSPIGVAKQLQDRLQSLDFGDNSNILVLKKTKPAMTFADSSPYATSAKLDDTMPATPVMAVPIAAARHRHRTPSPPPPPLPSNMPPAIIDQAQIYRSYEVSIHRSGNFRKHFEETREMLSTCLKLSPPNTVTFHI
ncbi:unnamed protein product [Caenorhabditis bovis]|uniref:PPM-type phosphatase domain-containing protein n=1 Tax=Caenorhabditis bovis TaxID=2654633 RepID=A0A8S1ER18_9PELO|nr:unnamed protein product [Caenorhabditis bovis]